MDEEAEAEEEEEEEEETCTHLCRILRVETRRVPGYAAVAIVGRRVVISGRVARIEGRADGRQLGRGGRGGRAVVVLMGMQRGRGRGRVWRTVLVWQACLCRRCVVS